MTELAVGIDLGGTNLRAALVALHDSGATIEGQQRRLVGQDRRPETVARAVAELVRSVRGEHRIPVGIGAAAMLRGVAGEVANAPNLGWRDVPFGALVAAELGEEVWLENDLSAIAWGEHCFGAGRGFRDIICVFVGTGVGGGGITQGVPLRGASNVALEIGHVKVEGAEGRLCGCGQRGCLEAYVGGRQLAEAAQELPSELLLEQVGGAADRLNGGHLDAAARAGCLPSAQLIARAAGYLGLVLANATTLLNPGCLLLGGTVWQGCPSLRERTLAAFETHVSEPARQAVQVVGATLGDDAGVLGAAHLARRQLG